MSYSNKEKAETLLQVYDALEAIDNIKSDDEDNINYISVTCYDDREFVIERSLIFKDKIFKIIDFLKDMLEQNKKEILADFVEESFKETLDEMMAFSPEEENKEGDI